MVSPAYFAGAIKLGGLMQTANAFGQVQNALSVFVNAYTSLAEWRAVIERLSGFDQSIAAARAVAASEPSIALAPDEATAVSFKDLSVRLPNGVPLINADDLSIKLGERVLVTGPSGAGKSTLFRALAGVWPFGSGTIQLPKDAKVMILPQRPYFPIGPLAAAVTYPAEPGEFDEGRIAELIAAVGLPALAARVDEEQHWNRMLSPGEQQRLGVARAILHAPITCSSTRPPPRSTSRRRPRSTTYCRRGCRKRRSFRSATARRCSRFISAISRFCLKTAATGCRTRRSKPTRRRRRQHEAAICSARR